MEQNSTKPPQQDKRMPWQAKTLIWGAAVLGIGTLLAPPEVQMTVVSLECAVPALIAIGKTVSLVRKQREINEAYYREYPEERPAYIRAEKRKKREEYRAQRELEQNRDKAAWGYSRAHDIQLANLYKAVLDAETREMQRYYLKLAQQREKVLKEKHNIKS